MKRTFIALDIPLTGETQTFLRAMKKRFNASGMKWVDVDNLHLTLQFVGATSSAQEQRIVEVLQQTVPSFSVFELTIKGLGVFCVKGEPRVGWFGTQPCSELMALQQMLQQKLNDVGVEGDGRIFIPHITFLRFKAGGRYKLLMEYIREHARSTFHTLFIQSVQYYASDLTAQGAAYSVIRSVPLG